jgi:DNA adenine methylase
VGRRETENCSFVKHILSRSLYLAQTKPRFKAILSDSNVDLINLYKYARDDVRGLIAVLDIHQSKYYENPDKYYYYMRDIYAPTKDTEKAARLIFLNRTCYNGLYRVNKSGLFNVPPGSHARRTICNSRKLIALSEILQRSDSEIICDNYMNVIQRCRHSDVIYLDPPYYPLSKTAYFKDYTEEEFGSVEQVLLANEFKRLSSIGCTVLLSNSNSSFIFALYQNYNIMTISTTRQINCDASNRLGHKELLITNRRVISPPKTSANYAQKIS